MKEEKSIVHMLYLVGAYTLGYLTLVTSHTPDKYIIQGRKMDMGAYFYQCRPVAPTEKGKADIKNMMVK